MSTDRPTGDVDPGAVERPTIPGGSDLPVLLIPVNPREPWGPWASIGWTVLCAAILVSIHFAVLVVYAVVKNATRGKVDLKGFSTSALFLSVSTIASTTAIVGLVALLIHIRRCSVRNYLALTLPRVRQVCLAVGGLALLMAATDLVTHLLGRPLIPQVMVGFYRSGWLSLLLITLVIAGPVGEEVLFRGFLYKGIASSRWGPTVATIVSSVGWSSLHVQYDLYGIGTIFLLGVYLGEVRRRTASLPLTVLLHGIANAVASIEVFVMISGPN